MKNKTLEEILNQEYLSAKDMQIIIPGWGINAARNYIKTIRDKMEALNYFVPPGKTKVALTRLVVEDLGIRRSKNYEKKNKN